MTFQDEFRPINFYHKGVKVRIDLNQPKDDAKRPKLEGDVVGEGEDIGDVMVCFELEKVLD